MSFFGLKTCTKKRSHGVEFVCAKVICALNKQGHTRADLKHTTRPKILSRLLPFFLPDLCSCTMAPIWESLTVRHSEGWKKRKTKGSMPNMKELANLPRDIFNHATVWWLCSCQAREVSIALPFGTNRIMSWNRRWDAFQVCLLVTIHHGNIREITGARGLHVTVDFAKLYLPRRVCEGAIRALAGIEKLTVSTRAARRWPMTSQSRVQITGWKYTATPRTML